MRFPSHFVRQAGRVIAALGLVVGFDSPGRAQEPAEPSGGEIAEPAPEPYRGPARERTTMTGDWLGARSALRDRGLTFDVSSTQYYQGVAGGGSEQAFQYGGRNDCFVNVDGEKLGLWSGFSVTLHGESRYGESANSIGGTLMAPNLMSAFPTSAGSVTALTNVTFTQSLCEELEIFAGKLNTLDGFEQPLTGADNFNGFQNTAMLYNPVFARTVPYATYGAGFSVLRGEESVCSVIVYDTNDTTTVAGFDTFFNNGATIYSELNLTTAFFDLPGHHGFSGTYSTGIYSDLTPTAYLDPIAGVVVMPRSRTGSWCLAYNCDQVLYVAPDDPERVWGVFGNFGIADDNPSPARWFGSVGLSGTGGLARRKEDSFGCAYFYLGVSESLKNLAPRLLPLRDEHGMELYYNYAVRPWCRITSDLQVITPFRERAETALLVGLRAHLDF